MLGRGIEKKEGAMAMYIIMYIGHAVCSSSGERKDRAYVVLDFDEHVALVLELGDALIVHGAELSWWWVCVGEGGERSIPPSSAGLLRAMD